nr:reductive dehalogenase [uncultured prokaryote]
MTEQKNTKISRRDFLRGVGSALAVAGISPLKSPLTRSVTSSGVLPDGYEYRDRSKQYPWWVKEVEDVTMEVDWDKIEPYDIYNCAALWDRHMHRDNFPEWVQDKPMIGLGKYVGRDGLIDLWHKKNEALEKYIEEGKPGLGLRDLSLREGAQSVYYGIAIDEKELTPQSPYINMSERFDVQWEGSPHEAAHMVEAAARHFGYAQVRYTYLERKLLYKHALDRYPPEMKYVIVPAVTWPMESTKRLNTMLGYSGIQMARVRNTFASWALKNFIRSLGYKCESVSGPSPAFATLAGLGEMSRINRLVSPIFGGAIYYSVMATDLPLAIDKPIDFGLMEFCENCKICAEVCPAGAMSMKDEPTWEVAGDWNNTGKKAYYEESVKCMEYLQESQKGCTLCLSSCPWTKQDKTALHDIARISGAMAPGASGTMAVMDKAFGYGPSEDPEFLEKWWDLDLPAYGLDTANDRDRLRS